MIAWPEIAARFKPGDTLQPLVGLSKLVVESIDDEQICIRQRLWRACVSRKDFHIASEILAASPAGTAPVQLAELIRRHYAGGPDVTTECTRIPNLAAVVLYNMGAVPCGQDLA